MPGNVNDCYQSRWMFVQKLEDNNTEKNVDSGRRPHSFHKGSHVLIESATMNLGSLGYEFLCVNQIGLRKQRWLEMRSKSLRWNLGTLETISKFCHDLYTELWFRSPGFITTEYVNVNISKLDRTWRNERIMLHYRLGVFCQGEIPCREAQKGHWIMQNFWYNGGTKVLEMPWLRDFH